MSYRLAVLGTVAALMSMTLPAQAESCIPIPLVGGTGNTVTKTVSQPTIPGPMGIKITRNNWNTDWAVPGGQTFRHFIITIIPQDTAQFTIQVFLRYSDQTADQFFNSQGETFPAGKPIVVKATTRPNDTPFQVNTMVNGIAAFGRTYTASVVGCR